jgi:hypothetical protein
MFINSYLHMSVFLDIVNILDKKLIPVISGVGPVIFK